jgi:DNA-directed RNA polymerase subunit beta
VLVAFMPWNGYNFEDAIVISERVVKEDIYTSIHISEFDVAARDTKLGPEEITRDIPNVGEEALRNLDHDGIIRIGAEVKPGDILVGKITPKSETELAPEERLLRAIFGEKAADVKDTSLRVPSGCTGIVQDVRVSQSGFAKKRARRKSIPPSSRSSSRRSTTSTRRRRTSSPTTSPSALRHPARREDPARRGQRPDRRDHHPGQPQDHQDAAAQARLGPRSHRDRSFADPQQDPGDHQLLRSRFQELDTERERKLDSLESGDEVDPGVIKEVKVFIAAKRKLSVGDKMAGRHGNKGVVATIVPEEDMPFLADGTPVDICLNPLGVPSRMNVGQVLETHLGVAAKALGFKVATPIFDGIKEEVIWDFMSEAKKVDGITMVGGGETASPPPQAQRTRRPRLTWIDGKDGTTGGKSTLYDGRTGEPSTTRSWSATSTC